MLQFNATGLSFKLTATVTDYFDKRRVELESFCQKFSGLLR